MRKSSYIIPVRLETVDDKYMLIHGYTGAMDIVPGDMLSKIDNCDIGEFSDDMVMALRKRGYLTDKTKEEEYAYVERLANALFKKNRMLYSYFTFVVTYNCNFRCPYCYERRDTKDGKHKIVFTPEMVDLAYKTMNDIQPVEKLRYKIITLYGGEPLLAENRDIVAYIINEGVKRGYRFSAVTNGYELDSFVDFLDKDKITSVQITIDGPRESHDKRRIHYTGHGTFDKVVDNVLVALAKGIGVSVRMNTDGHNMNELEELKRFFEDKGFFSYKTFKFYSAPIKDNDSMSGAEHETLNLVSGSSFVKQHKLHHTEQQCQDFGVTKRILDAVKDKKPISFGSVFCAAQSNGYLLDPLGRIYPCWETVNKEEHILGTYLGGEINWNDDVVNRWRSSNINANTQCLRCRYALLCKGGCPFHRLGNKTNKAHCSFFRDVFNVAVNNVYKKAKASSLIV